MKAHTPRKIIGLLGAVGAGFALAAIARRNRFSFRGRTVIITGGSRGLGLVLARHLARKGARLALLARDGDTLRRAEMELINAGAEVLGVACDVRRQAEVNEAVRQVVDRFGGVDILINNAGVIQVGPFEHMTVADFEDAMAVHLFGPLYATLAALPHLRRARAGRIVNIASIGGKVAVPHLLPYTASKFALVGFSDGLRSELRKDGIRVTTVCPCLMRTGSPWNAYFKGRNRAEYAWFAISDALPGLSMNVDRAARRIIAACRRGAPRLLLGMPVKAAAMAAEALPGLTARLLAAANRLLPGMDAEGHEPRTGWESQSAWAPSWLTRLNEEAALRNNE